MARRCWKHSRQKTGRPWVGRKGTVVSLPHWEQVVLVSERICEAPPPPRADAFGALGLATFATFWFVFEALVGEKHLLAGSEDKLRTTLRTLQDLIVEFHEPLPLAQFEQGEGRTLHHGPGCRISAIRGNRARTPWGLRVRAATQTQRLCLTWAYITEVRRWGLSEEGSDGPDREVGAVEKLVRFPPLLFAQSLPRKRFFSPALFAGLHIEAMLLDFLDDVFLLHLALETAQSILQRFTFLDDDFSHVRFTPNPVRIGFLRCHYELVTPPLEIIAC